MWYAFEDEACALAKEVYTSMTRSRAHIALCWRKACVRSILHDVQVRGFSREFCEECSFHMYRSPSRDGVDAQSAARVAIKPISAQLRTIWTFDGRTPEERGLVGGPEGALRATR